MSGERTPLKARMEDLVSACANYGFAVGNFLSEEERAEAGAILAALQKSASFTVHFYGGVKGAERTLPLLLDRCYADAAPADFADIAILKLTATDNSLLGHRAVMGSILSLGIERRMLGDIFRYEDGMAVAVKERMLPYISKELDKVGGSRVAVSRVCLPEDFEIVRETEELTLSVASLRLDCMVAAICKCAREDAAEYISSGKVQVAHKEQTRPDFRLSAPATVSIKGKGRFLFEKEEGVTKSGRLRVKILRYI